MGLGGGWRVKEEGVMRCVMRSCVAAVMLVVCTRSYVLALRDDIQSWLSVCLSVSGSVLSLSVSACVCL
eukprot:COSAG06_NODE_53809_length_298_cov_0.477387_1_plen_68_part_01